MTAAGSVGGVGKLGCLNLKSFIAKVLKSA